MYWNSTTRLGVTLQLHQRFSNIDAAHNINLTYSVGRGTYILQNILIKYSTVVIVQTKPNQFREDNFIYVYIRGRDDDELFT